MLRLRKALWGVLLLALVGALALGCSGDKASDQPPDEVEEATGSAEFPEKDPAQPFVPGERGTVALTNDQAYDIQFQRENGDLLFRFVSKKGAIIDPSVQFTAQTLQVEVPEELASQYVPVGEYGIEIHVLGDTGYGFALRPKIEIHFSEQEVEAAKQAGASLDTLKGNLVVLYKEQRSPRWVPQTSLSWDEESKVVTVSNVAGAGAWRLVARKAQ